MSGIGMVFFLSRKVIIRFKFLSFLAGLLYLDIITVDTEDIKLGRQQEVHTTEVPGEYLLF